jgi:hypothetical protein
LQAVPPYLGRFRGPSTLQPPMPKTQMPGKRSILRAPLPSRNKVRCLIRPPSAGPGIPAAPCAGARPPTLPAQRGRSSRPREQAEGSHRAPYITFSTPWPRTSCGTRSPRLRCARRCGRVSPQRSLKTCYRRTIRDRTLPLPRRRRRARRHRIRRLRTLEWARRQRCPARGGRRRRHGGGSAAFGHLRRPGGPHPPGPPPPRYPPSLPPFDTAAPPCFPSSRSPTPPLRPRPACSAPAVLPPPPGGNPGSMRLQDGPSPPSRAMPPRWWCRSTSSSIASPHSTGPWDRRRCPPPRAMPRARSKGPPRTGRLPWGKASTCRDNLVADRPLPQAARTTWRSGSPRSAGAPTGYRGL